MTGGGCRAGPLPEGDEVAICGEGCGGYAEVRELVLGDPLEIDPRSAAREAGGQELCHAPPGLVRAPRHKRLPGLPFIAPTPPDARSEEHTSELQSRFGISYAVF